MRRSARVRRQRLRTGFAAALLACVAVQVSACVPTPFVKAAPAVTVTATPTPTPGHLIVAGFVRLYGPRTHFYTVDGHPDRDESCTALPGMYAGVGEGSPIDVMSTSDAASVVATGFLRPGFVAELADHTLTCTFRFALLDVPAGLGLYEIDIDGHSWGPLTEAQIQQSDYLGLGD